MNRNNQPAVTEDVSIIVERLNKPVAIVGMMGVGKSHVGKTLAGMLELAFFDSDHIIEKKAGYSISEIFEKFGEEKFRLSEARVIQELLNNGPCVVSTGGGALLNEETRKAVREKSISIWLRADKDDLVKRLKNSRDRPLLRGENIEETIDRLMRAREVYYEQCDLVVDAVPGSVQQTVETVIKTLSAHCKNVRFPA
jgi:shikimate kinase